MRKNLLLVYLILFSLCTFAQVRFVSKIGSSTPPYTSWETASDSIQKCINICNDGDTVVVANGVYKEFLITKTAITLLGSSMDSCIIDGTGLGVYYTVEAKKITLAGFKIIGKGVSTGMWNAVVSANNININSCTITNANVGVAIGPSSGRVENLIIKDVEIGVHTFCAYDTCKPVISNCVILLRHYQGNLLMGIDNYHNGQPTVENNIILGPPKQSASGISNLIFLKSMKVWGNMIAGFIYNIEVNSIIDTALIVNNVLLDYQKRGDSDYEGSIWAVGDKSYIRNNIIANSYIGINVLGSPNSDYNLFWNNSTNATDARGIGAHDIFADPMFVKDTLAYSGMGDFHLQKYSPAIDAGDPSILDKDGSRSDIGMYGGPTGESYTYQDLAPKPPRNLTAAVNNGNITLKWLKNTETDFSYYKVYRDESANFTYDSTKTIALISDTTYTEPIPQEGKTIYYKVTAWDNTYHQSPASEEVAVKITNVEKPLLIANDYKLFQNYPNPFNPTTMISYRIKERGYVKLVVHDIKGELVKVLVNKEQEAGYYEETFSADGLTQPDLGANNFASGIYLFSLTVIGEKGIPVFTDMKKSILLK